VVSFSQVSPLKRSHLPHTCSMPPSHSSWFDHPDNVIIYATPKKINNTFTSKWLPKVSRCWKPSGTCVLNFRYVVLVVSWKNASKFDRINIAKMWCITSASGTEFLAGRSSKLCHDQTVWWFRKENWLEDALSVKTVEIKRTPPYKRLVPMSLTDVLKVRILTIPNIYTQKICVCVCDAIYKAPPY
jgi:hypothetical protein